MKQIKLFIASIAFFASFSSFGQIARLQVIHNSADAAATEVDIYLNNTLLLDNFKFRTATPFIDAPAGVQFTIGVAPSTSTMSSQSVATFPVTLTAGETYVVVANGIVSPTGYSPAPAFTLDVYAMSRETATNSANTDVLVCHGSTDAPTVDVVESTAGTVVNDASFGDFAGYLELPTADYVLNVQDMNNTVTVAAYQAPLSTLSLNGAAIVVVASGFLNPAANSNGPVFGLLVALPSGGDLIALPTTSGLSIDETEAVSFQLYPNPTENVLMIQSKDLNGENFIISDITGKTIASGTLNGINAVDVSFLQKGKYFIRISYETVYFLKN